MEHQADKDREAYRATCQYYRKGHVVYAVDGSVVFDGTEKVKEEKKYWQKASKSKSYIPEPKGCNAAKRYITKNGLKSYTVRD